MIAATTFVIILSALVAEKIINHKQYAAGVDY
jgi:hypothetical protein